MFYVYILLSLRDSRTYTGFSKNYKRRFIEHNSGKVKSTRNRLPFTIIHTEQYLSMSQAKQHERYWKSSIGRKKMKKIFNVPNQ